MSKYTKKTNEQKREEVKEIMGKLEEGVTNVFTSEEYEKVLNFFSKFHHYSYRNIILIMLQNPLASNVASFTTWKNLGCKVKKGSKAMKILCPIPYKYKKEVTNEDGTVEEVESSGINFKLGNVFDISQVEGEIPSLTKQLEGNSEELKALIDYTITNSPTKIVIDSALNGRSENGYYHKINKDIHVKESLDDLHKVKTIVHELAHSILHPDIDDGLTSQTKEVQAESTAYIVCNYLGLDTSDYSFGYVAGWSRNKELKELKESLDVIEKTSKGLIDFFEKGLDNR